MLFETLAMFFAIPLAMYGFLAIMLIAFFVAAAKESLGGGFALLLILGLFGVIKAGGLAAAGAFVAANWIFFAIGAAAFVPVSILWARFKWSLYTTDKVEEIKEMIANSGYEKAVEHYAYRSPSSANEIRNTNFACLSPKVRDNKGRITTWIALCVPSMIWFLIHDPITRFADWAYKNIREWFQTASDEKFKREFAKVAKPAPKAEATEKGTLEERR